MPEAKPLLIDIAGRYMHVQLWGADGETVVIAHGVTGCSADHRPLAKHLRSLGFRVLVPDAPGCGRSDPPADSVMGFGLGAFAMAFRQMIDATGGQPVHWIGASKGGGLGIRLAGEAPAYVRSLTLYDVGITLPSTMTQALSKRLAVPPRFASLVMFRDHVARFFERSGYALTPERLDEIALDWSRRTDDGAVTYHYDPGTALQFQNCPEDFDLWPQWDAIACPTLLLRGEHSEVLPPEEAQEMETRNPHACAREIVGAGHVNMLDDPDLQNIIAKFITENQTDRRART